MNESLIIKAYVDGYNAGRSSMKSLLPTTFSVGSNTF